MDALRNELRSLVVTTLGLKDVTAQDIDDEAPLFGEGEGLELDSLDALELAVAFEFEYGLEAKLEGDSDETRAVFRSIASLADFISANRTK